MESVRRPIFGCMMVKKYCGESGAVVFLLTLEGFSVRMVKDYEALRR